MISVIVPAYNAAPTLGGCLEALLDQSVPRDQYEIVVVDDGSTDATAETARRAGAAVVTVPHRCAAAARNAGVRAAHGDLILFTDADCRPARDWIEQMTAPFADPEVIGAKGIYTTQQPQVFARFVQLEYEDKYDRLRGRERIDFIDTYSAAYRRAPFEAAGGFDPEMMFAEDQELSFRLASQGAKLVFAPRAVVDHLHAASLRAYARKKVLGGFWKFRAAGRHKSKFVSDSHTPPVMKVQMLLVLLAALLAVVSLLVTQLLWLLAATLGVFLLTTVPFVAKAWNKDREVAIAAPLILMVRAVALTAGSLAAVASAPRRFVRRLFRPVDPHVHPPTA